MAHLEGNRSGSAPQLEPTFVGEAQVDESRKNQPLPGPVVSAPWKDPASWLPPAMALFLLLLWELLSRLGLLSTLFFPPPSAIAQVTYNLLRDGILVSHTTATVARLLLGLLLGGSTGYLLGLLMGWSRGLARVVDPFVSAAHPIPKIAILPLFLVILGIGETSRVFVVALGTFFPLLINSMAGVRQIHPLHFEVAKNYGAGRWATFRRVVLPGSLPLALTGLRLAFNVALLLTISIEIIGAPQGLGSMIWRAWQTMRTEELYTSLAVIMLLGMGFNLLVAALAHRLLPWQPQEKRI